MGQLGDKNGKMKSGCNIKFGGLYYRTKKMEKKMVSPRVYWATLEYM